MHILTDYTPVYRDDGGDILLLALARNWPLIIETCPCSQGISEKEAAGSGLASKNLKTTHSHQMDLV